MVEEIEDGLIDDVSVLIREGNYIIDNFVRLFKPNQYFFGVYHEDWNALMIACDIWDEIIDSIPNEYFPVYRAMSDNIDNNITTHNIMATFRTLMWAITWYNNVCLQHKTTTDGLIIEKPKNFKI